MNDSPMAAPRGFVLCGDDYGMTPGVSRGILALLAAGRITATGAMTNMPGWQEAACALRAFDGLADLGVHLNLTCGTSLSGAAVLDARGALPTLAPLLAKGLAGQLPQAEIEREFEAQLGAFEDRMGRMPDFVDGHQHVHAMPGIRRALAAVLARRYPASKPYVRDAADHPRAIWVRGFQRRKAMIVAGLARPFAAGMAARGFRLNRGFAGFSAFKPEEDYAAAFASYLKAAGAAHLVMCHPGEVDDALRALDPATESRPREITYFLSARFAEDCAAAGMLPVRFSALGRPGDLPPKRNSSGTFP